MKPLQIVVVLAVLVVGIGSGYLLGRGGSAGPELVQAAAAQPAAERAAAQQAATPTRTLLLTVDDPGNPGYDVALGVVDFPPGSDTGRHDHPGIEVGYILEGTLEMSHDGRETQVLTAGGSFHNDAPHRAVNVGSTPARLVAVWIVDRARPMAEPVP